MSLYPAYILILKAGLHVGYLEQNLLCQHFGLVCFYFVFWVVTFSPSLSLGCLGVTSLPVVAVPLSPSERELWSKGRVIILFYFFNGIVEICIFDTLLMVSVQFIYLFIFYALIPWLIVLWFLAGKLQCTHYIQYHLFKRLCKNPCAVQYIKITISLCNRFVYLFGGLHLDRLVYRGNKQASGFNILMTCPKLLPFNLFAVLCFRQEWLGRLNWCCFKLARIRVRLGKKRLGD